MLDSWLASLSKTTIAIGAIVIGTLFIVFVNPPHSVCDVQGNLFKEEIGKYFFIDPKEKKILKRSRFASYLDDCRSQNSPGGCYQFFSTLALLERELENLNDQCIKEIGEAKEIKDAVWEASELIVRLAWGETAPDTYVNKVGWLTPVDVAIFCRTKRQALRIFGDSRWKNFEGTFFSKLSGASDLPREEAWSRMLLSIPCQSYL